MLNANVLFHPNAIDIMILHPKSPLNFLPTEFENSQLMLLDSLRFTLEMIDYNFGQLENHLEQISSGKANKIHYKVFNYAWTLIDHCQRFCLLYKRLPLIEKSEIGKLDYLYSFRNAIQHLDKNVEERIIKNSRPIYGSIKWIVNDIEKKEIYNSLLISGIFNLGNIEFSSPTQENYPRFINDIRLETDTLKKDEDNEINLSKLILEISAIILELESRLLIAIEANKLQLKDWKSRKDIVLNMKRSDAV